jgi:iron(III) transport system substrate-binding protein
MRRFSMVLLALMLTTTARAAELCANPRQMEGFKTCADIAKAEAEGSVVIYSTDPEDGSQKVLDRFHKMFPKIATGYVRLQAGALYAKLLTERKANSYLVDIVQLSDMSLVLDFQKRGGWMEYQSPEMVHFQADWKSKPEGFWTWGAIGVAALAYNTNLVPADQAPKTWLDAVDPRWKDSITSKASTSGMEHMTWYLLREMYGEDYWKKFAALNPKGFDSYVQQYGRTIDGQEKIIHTAQYSGYLLAKAKGAPIGFVYPPDGLIAVPEGWGAVKEAPHPEAARLFIDWFLGLPGQNAYGQDLMYNSLRPDVTPPPGGVSPAQMKLLYPKDWDAFIKTHAQFVKEWDHITGVR